MHHRLRWVGRVWVVVVTLSIPTVVHGQQDVPGGANHRSLVLGGPSTLAIRLPLGSHWAVRPDIAIAMNWFRVGETRRTVSTTGVGMSVLRTLTVDQDLQTYIGSRLGVSHQELGSGSSNTIMLYDVFAGGEAAVTGRIGILAEFGVRASDLDTSTPDLANRNIGLTLRSAVGVSIRF